MSELLNRIDSALSTSLSPDHRGSLLARKGMFLARIGRFQEARAITLALRRDFPVDICPGVRILTILLEGVIDLYENLSEYGHDRIRRADMLAVSTREVELISVASSWRAHVEFERSDFRAMAAAIARVHNSAASDAHEALARTARILSDSFALVGDRQKSKKWFDIAHRHAVQAGDQAMLDALIYNRVAFGLSRLRSESHIAALDMSGIQHMDTALASSRAYQSLIGARALTHLVDISTARLLILKGEYKDAIAVLTGLSQFGPMAKNNYSEDLFRIEIAFCNAKLGNIDEAAENLAQLSSDDFPGIDVDDRLAAAWMRHEMALLNQNLGVVAITAARLNELRAEYKIFIDRIGEAIAEFDATL